MAAPYLIDVLSDSTGETAERVVRAALLQFPQAGVSIRRHPRVRTQERASPILERAARDGALLVFSVVSPELSAYIHASVVDLGIDAVDVIGSVIGHLERYLGRDPINRPGALMPLGDDYFRRVAAVEFTVKADAGANPGAILEADLTLVGVARTSKTPVATLLAQRGLRVANLTLAFGRKPPAELFRVPQDRIVALTIGVEELCAIRRERLSLLGMPAETQYGVVDHVRREIEYAETIFAENPSWPVVDISGRSVDETAAIVLEMRASG